MPIVTAAIIGGIATAASAASSAYSQQQANKTNIRLARENREFQADLADTAHQREVRDLRLAGLNPILSGTGGAGAAVPSSAAAQVGPVNPVGDVGKGIASAVMARAQLDLIREQTRKTSAEATTAEQQKDVGAMNLEDEKNYRAFLQSRGYYPTDPETGKTLPLSEDFKSDYNYQRHVSRFDAERTGGRAAQAGVQLTEEQTKRVRQEIVNLVQTHNIGQSAEAQARILRDVYTSSPGELLKLLQILKDLIK